jgi:hypothetical protein
MPKSLLRTSIAIALLALVGAGAAQALKLRVGNLTVVTDGGFTPTTLPKRQNAPIKLFGFARFSTKDGTRPSPLRRLTLEFDKHGAVETRGLEKCAKRKLEHTTTARARKSCPGAIVGTGFGTGIVEFPEQRPIEVSSPITIFNGPRKNGNPTVFGHAYLDDPVGPVTYVVPIEIETINRGRYGFRTVADIPRIANDYGSPTFGRLRIGREWKHRGKRLSFANAHCADGRLQARGEFSFKNGDSVKGTLFKPCQVRR